MSTDETRDRFGDLPDSVVFDILSYLNTKEAFQTCILSKRWNNLTNNLPIITLDSAQFEYLDSLERALSQILSVRNEFDDVLQTLDLTLTPFNGYWDDFTPLTDVLFKRTVTYALSHNVQRLRYPITCYINPFPPLFSSQTLTSLDLTVPPRIATILFPTHLNLPSLTDLTLSYFRFGAGDDDSADPFATFNKLTTLTIINCGVVNPPNRGMFRKSRDIVNPPNRGMFRISPPSLCNFAFTGRAFQKLCLTHPSSLKHLYIEAEDFGNDDALVEQDSAVLLNWLQGLTNIRSLTVSSNTLLVLSVVPNLFKVKLTSFYNLESLQIQMKPLSCQLYSIFCHGRFMRPGVKRYQDTIIADGVVECLIQNSPSANVTVIPYNKIQVPRKVKMKDPRWRNQRRPRRRPCCRKAKQI